MPEATMALGRVTALRYPMSVRKIVRRQPVDVYRLLDEVVQDKR
jgi:hypothetical protein